MVSDCSNPLNLPEGWKYARLRSCYDIVQNGSVLLVPFHVNQIGITCYELYGKTTLEQGSPGQDNEAPVQWRAEEFFHEPEGMPPLVQTNVGRLISGRPLP